VYLNLDLVNNAKVTGADEMDYDAQSGRPFAVFRAAARSKGKRDLKAEEGLSRSHPLQSLDAELLTRLSTTATVPETARKILAEAIPRQKELQEMRAAEENIQADNATIEKDVQRMREHLKAAGGDKGQGQAQAANPFVQRILAAEDKLVSNRKRLERAAAELKQKTAALQSALEKLKE